MILPFGAERAGDRFHEIFKEQPHVFGIADDILVVGYECNGPDHAKTLQKVQQICRKEISSLTSENPISDA